MRTPTTMRTGADARAAFAAAAAAAHRVLNPAPAQQHLEGLAFAAGVLHQGPRRFATEEQQYVHLYEARRAQLGRALWPAEASALRSISREIWLVLRTTHEGDRPQ